ncbi:hypothetical protein HMI54_001066 [Coelomomyces lativittatus]|nr:hypothetical protein HMI56_005523 [Coelomomyces lativittatus]KAJ1501676.1 hypothetical protein HMI55_003272 [Coelomomyces lativittatus]KAJ1518370.1 hypothetical protein HMI54_001066 [Coelomomyces lativittatus]
MLHLLGVNLPDHKRVPVALSRFYGIGYALGTQLCHKLLIHPHCKLGELTTSQINALGTLLNGMTLEAELKRQTQHRILHHVQLNTVKGMKFKLGLPVRGQRVRTNARTAEKLNKKWLVKSLTTYTQQETNGLLPKGQLLARHLPSLTNALKFFKK